MNRLSPSSDSRPLVYDSNYQALSTARFRRAGLLATAGTCKYSRDCRISGNCTARLSARSGQLHAVTVYDYDTIRYIYARSETKPKNRTMMKKYFKNANKLIERCSRYQLPNRLYCPPREKQSRRHTGHNARYCRPKVFFDGRQ